jgi:hypothetical protein
MNIRTSVAYALGAVDALLLARLILRLLAARPDNPAIAVLYTLTTIPGTSALDAGQPRFGATLEFSTLALFLLILAVGLLIGQVGRRLEHGQR